MTKPDPSQPKKDDQQQTLDLYKAYLDDFGRIGTRHETLRQYYLSVISALFVFLAMAGGKEGLFRAVSGSVLNIVGLVGILICVAWLFHMWSFGTIFKAKRASLKEIEKRLPAGPFTFEDDSNVGRLQDMWRLRLTVVDRCVAGVFIALFAWLLFAKLESP